MAKKSAFEAFTADDVLRGNKWRGRELTSEEVSQIKSQAAEFSQSFLWKVLKAELQFYALKSLIENGEDKADIRIARIFGNIVQEIDKKLLNM